MAFQNYYPGYQNPAIINQQQRLNPVEQIYPQYQQQLYQQQQPVQQNFGVNGRVVDDVSSINFNEVSTDNNSPSVFVKQDLSEIYLKRYNQNGIIETYTYKLKVDEQSKTSDDNSKSFEDMFTEFSVMFDDKLKSIDEKLNKALSNQHITTTQKGGGK